ncbi:MAG TPA: chemotaxis protein CheD [Coriobacteriia bacterium]|jgi:chemotaxis protein CheD
MEPLRAAGTNVIEVGVGELAFGQFPSLLMTPALGSCVGFTLWDDVKQRGGMAHIMLPSAGDSMMKGEPTRFATVAVPMLVDKLVRMGSPVKRLEAKLAGGSAMFRGDFGMASIGERNVAEVKAQLDRYGIRPVAEDTGGNHARTIELHLDTGLLVVRSYLYGIREL